MSRTTRRSGCPEGVTNHRGKGRFRNVSVFDTSVFHQGYQFFVGEGLQCVVNADEAGFRLQEEWEGLRGKFVPLIIRQGSDFLG